MTPRWGNTFLFHSFQQVPPLCLRPFKGPEIASCIASRTIENQVHRQVCCAKREGPRTLSRTTDAKLICAFVENALRTFVVPKIGTAWTPLPPLNESVFLSATTQRKAQ